MGLDVIDAELLDVGERRAVGERARGVAADGPRFEMTRRIAPKRPGQRRSRVSGSSGESWVSTLPE